MSGAQSALRLYPLSSPEFHLIRQNENQAFYVKDGEREFLLRIHQAAQGFDTGILTGLDSREARLEKELNALTHLRRKGMLVQEPVYSKSGRAYEILADGSLASMLTWIPGEALGKGYINHLDGLGKMAAGLHRAARGLEGGVRYDASLAARLQEELDAAAALGHINQTDCLAGKRALEIIREVIQDAGRTPASTGFIHADLGFTNILLTKDGLVPIDFSLSGSGCLAQDIGMMLTNVPDIRDRRALVKAYEKASETMLLPRQLDAFYCLSILLFVCCQDQRFYQEAWFPVRMNFWSEHYFKALSAGKKFSV